MAWVGDIPPGKRRGRLSGTTTKVGATGARALICVNFERKGGCLSASAGQAETRRGTT